MRINSAEFLTAEAVTSSTQSFDGSTAAGPAYFVAFDHNAKFFVANATYNDRSEGFQTLPGFIDRNNIRSLDSNLAYTVRKARNFLLSWGPQLLTENVWDHAANHLTTRYQAIANVEMVRQTNLSVFYEKRSDLLRPSDFSQLISNKTYSEQTSGINISTNPMSSVELLASYADGTGINFIPAVGPPVSAHSSIASASLSFRIGSSLTINNTYLLARLTSPQGRSIFNDHTLRSKWTYYFSRSLYARTIIQYNNVITNRSLVNSPRQRMFNADFLFTYLPHPGTAVFVGYNSDLANIDRTLGLTADGQLKRQQGLINDGRQVFGKVMYLFRRCSLKIHEAERKNMVIILFRSNLTTAAGADYASMNAELEEYVKTQPGFLDVKAFRGEDSERLTVVWWRDKETLQCWQNNARHIEAKTSGRKKWYQYYKMEVAEVFRESSFDKSNGGSAPSQLGETVRHE